MLKAKGITIINSMVGARIKFQLDWGNGTPSEFTDTFGPKNRRTLDLSGITHGTTFHANIKMVGRPKYSLKSSDLTFSPNGELGVFEITGSLYKHKLNGPLQNATVS